MLLRWTLPIADHRLIAVNLKGRVAKTSGGGMLVGFLARLEALMITHIGKLPLQRNSQTPV